MRPLLVMDADAIGFKRGKTEEESARHYQRALKKEVERLEREGYLVLTVRPGSRVVLFAGSENGTREPKEDG